MTGILDKIKINQKRFSKLSLINSLVTLGLSFYFFILVPENLKASEFHKSTMVIIAIQLFCLTGIIMTILSFTKKEPSNWFKWIGAILNILFFWALIGSVIFAMIIDYTLINGK